VVKRRVRPRGRLETYLVSTLTTILDQHAAGTSPLILRCGADDLQVCEFF
jgi:hypothetical protein